MKQVLTYVTSEIPRWSLGLYITIVYLVLILIHDCLLDAPQQSTRVIETAYGKVQGVIIKKSGDLPLDVEGYLGIPYASSPAASLRFMPPLTPSHWDGIRPTANFGPVCPQLLPDISNRTNALHRMPLLKYTRFIEISRLLANQSEDCLHLNIYRPALDEPKVHGSSGGERNPRLLAIVVILHGESWEWGSGNLVDGSALASVGQLMVVTLNYRLGALGFLQTSSQQGNFAIMDVVAALNWISQNGAAFGGDVNRITLFGHRTGAVLANFLMLAPVATELFHRVILLSGSVMSPWSFQRNAKTNIRKLAQYFKCTSTESPLASAGVPFSAVGRIPGAPAPSSDLREIGPCLRDIPLDSLLDAVRSELTEPRFLSRFGPLVDGTVVKSDFVSEMSVGSFGGMELLVGSSTVESFGELSTEDIEDGLGELKRDRILRTLVRNIFVFHLNEIFSTIKNEYTDWEKPRKDYMDVRDSILNILSDALTLAPLIHTASIHSAIPKAKTFVFHFQYEADNSMYPNRIGSISEDLLDFSVGLPVLNRGGKESIPSYTQSDTKVSNSLMHYLTNFIVSGDPNVGAESASIEDGSGLTYWDSYDPSNQQYLEIGSGDGRMRSHYRGHKMALWLNLIPQLHQSGGSDVSMLHHNFKEEKQEHYDGSVREQHKQPPTADPSVFRVPNPRFKPMPRSDVPIIKPLDGELDLIGSGILTDDYEDELPPRNKGPTQPPAVMSSSECPPNSTSGNPTIFKGHGNGSNSADSTAGGDIVRQLAASHYHSYGTALGVTIGVGCCLLLLNLLIFLAIYHQKTQNPPPVRANNSKEEDAMCENCRRSSGQCGHHSNNPRGFPYGDGGGGDEEFEEEDLIRELRQSRDPSHLYLHKDVSCSSGFSSPPIPDPPPPPRSIPPSLGGSMASLSSPLTGSLRRGRPTVVVLDRDQKQYRDDYDRDSSYVGSMNKRELIHCYFRSFDLDSYAHPWQSTVVW